MSPFDRLFAAHSRARDAESRIAGADIAMNLRQRARDARGVDGSEYDQHWSFQTALGRGRMKSQLHDQSDVDYRRAKQTTKRTREKLQHARLFGTASMGENSISRMERDAAESEAHARNTHYTGRKRPTRADAARDLSVRIAIGGGGQRRKRKASRGKRGKAKAARGPSFF